MKIPYLGKMVLFWCMKCNVPVLGSECTKCSGKTKKVEVTPPGDIRPAFNSDIKLINKIARKEFGSNIIQKNKIILLNSAPGLDRFDEIIMDGRVIGVLKYNVKRLDYAFLPRLFGARLFDMEKLKRFVEIADDALPYILKGASVLMPGVVDFDKKIKKWDEVIVICNEEVVGVGSARLSGRDAKGQRKGMFVKIRRRASPKEAILRPSGQKWETVLEANSEIIEKFEAEALEFIKNVAKKHAEKPKTVAFSGGKDSLVTLLLVKKVIPDINVIFTDTGIELPETLEYIKETISGLGLDLITESAGDGFWRAMEYFGPPGRDYRWCCKISKLGPTTRLILKHFPDGCVSFIGQRKYESEIRARSRRIWNTPWIPIQLSASPIQHWTALHVWLYIKREGVGANKLYEEGMERLGCFMCPASDISEFEIVEELHPDLWKKWSAALEASGIKEEEMTYGLWRWKGEKGNVMEIAREAGIDIKKRKIKSKTQKFDFKRARNMARILGDVKYGKTYFSVNGVKVSKDGKIEGENDEVRGIIKRASNCFGCGVCLGQCKIGAIELRNEKAWVADWCTGCMRCHHRCPIIKY